MVKVGFPNQLYLILKCEKIIVTLFLIPFLAFLHLCLPLFLLFLLLFHDFFHFFHSFLPLPSLFPFCLIYKSQKQYILIILILLKLLRRFLRSKYLSIIPVLYCIHAYVCHRAFWYHSRDPATVFDWHISSHYTCFQENSELDISRSLIPAGLLQMCHDGLYWNNLLRIIFILNWSSCQWITICWAYY